MPSPADVPTARQWTRVDRIRATVAYWLLVGACLIVSGGGFYLVYLEGLPGRTARRVSATIEHVEVLSTNDGHGRLVKKPLVIYSYTIDGIRYTTDRLTSLGRIPSDSWTAGLARRFHPGETVPAYVATLDPQSAFLIEDRDWRPYAFLVVPLAIALGLAVYWPWAGIRDLTVR